MSDVTLTAPDTKPTPLQNFTNAAGSSAAVSDMALSGGPVARRDGIIMELTRYQQDGKITIDGDTVTQQLGRGRIAEYSLNQMAAHSKDSEYFENTMRYAAKHGESVTIDVHDCVAGVSDPILHAAVKHDVDPVLLAAVGTQESHLGANYLGSSKPAYDMKTHRGDVEPDSKGGHGYGPFQLDDRSHTPAQLARAASDPYYAADMAASMLSGNLKARHVDGDVDKALHLYNSGKLSIPSSTTDWGPLGKLSYQKSTMRYYREIGGCHARSRPYETWGFTLKASILALLVIGSVGVASGASQQHFFPARPTDAHLRSDSGVLTSYGVGNDTGGFTIERKGKTETFYLGYPLTIDRMLYRCLPTPARTHDEDECKRWPSRVVIGKSRVRVTYWWAMFGDRKVKVSDRITTIGR